MWFSAILSYFNLLASPSLVADEQVKLDLTQIGIGVEQGDQQVETDSSMDKLVDNVCVNYCDDYFFKYCGNSNYFMRKYENNRKLRFVINEKDLPRQSNDLRDQAIEDCQTSCMLWPRFEDPALFHNQDASEEERKSVLNSNLSGDTFYCHETMMHLIKDYKDAAVQCQHASDADFGICTDVLVDGFTPYELLREGYTTRHHYGYCDVALSGTVAQCTRVDITDDDLANALIMIPPTVKIIFLNGNRITNLPAYIFRDNLKNPDEVQAIYLNDNLLTTLDANALIGLPNLKIFNANSNPIVNIPENFFALTPELLQFEMFLTNIRAVPGRLFSNTPNIQRIVINGSNGLTFLYPETFRGLSKLHTLRIVNCNLDNAGIPDGVFSDLVSLKYLDLHTNSFTSVEARWFAGGWGKQLTRLNLYGNPIETVENEVFDDLDAIQDVFLHRTSLQTIDMSLFDNKENFSQITLG